MFRAGDLGREEKVTRGKKDLTVPGACLPDGFGTAKRGLSMVELLISAAILTVVATSVLAINALPRRAALHLEDRMKASLYLEQRLNELRSQDFSLLTDGTQTEPAPVLSNGALTFTVTTPEVSRPEWKEVFLSLSWTDRRGGGQAQDLISSLYDHTG